MKPLDTEISKTINQLVDDMRQAETQVSARQPFNLEGLGDRIQGICETLQDLPVDAASPFLPQLEQIYDAVDRLVDAIDEADAIGDEAKGAE